MSVAADSTAARKRAEADAAQVRAEWEAARSALNKAADADEDRELLTEQHQAMQQSLQSAVAATQMAEQRARYSTQFLAPY